MVSLNAVCKKMLPVFGDILTKKALYILYENAKKALYILYNTINILSLH